MKFFFPGYSCSCPPFECICGLQSSMTTYQSSQNHHPHHSHHHHHQSTGMYNPQTVSTDTPYWLQDQVQSHDNTLGYTLPSQVPQEAAYPDFPAFTGDLFQPEEIFQLDQPLRPDFPMNAQDVARSPSTLLDLGSGTIKYEMKQENQDNYWTQFLSEDSSSSHLSLPHQQEDRLQLHGFDTDKDFESNRRSMNNCYPMAKDANQNNSLSETINYPSYHRAQNQKEFDNRKNDQNQSYWCPEEERVHFPGFESSQKETNLIDERNSYVFQKHEDLNKSQSMNQTLHPSRSPSAENNSNFTNFNSYQVIEPVTKSPANRSPHHHDQQRVLDDRLNYSSHEQNPAVIERLFSTDPSTTETAIHSQNSPEPFFYPSNDRCQYTCEVLDTRIPQVPVNNNHHPVNYDDVTDLELPAFVDYTLVGMLCSSGNDETSSGILSNCSQTGQNYVPNH